MARTAAGRDVITSAMRLQIDELEYVIARLIATRDLDIPSIQQKSETIQAEMEARQEERQTTMSRIVAALRILPGYVFRQLVVCILQDNPLNRQLLVGRWEEHFDDLDTEFEGDPYLGDALALFTYMNAKSSLTLRLIISFMAGNDGTLREYLKRMLLITKEDGSFQIRIFDPFEREPSPEIELAPRISRIDRMLLSESSSEPVVNDEQQSLRDTSSDWGIEEKFFVRDASECSYVSDTPSFREEAAPEFAEVLELDGAASLRNTSNDLETEETMSARESPNSDLSYGSDKTPLPDDASSDYVENDSEPSDESSLGNTPLREAYEVTDISGWTDGMEARFRAN